MMTLILAETQRLSGQQRAEKVSKDGGTQDKAPPVLEERAREAGAAHGRCRRNGDHLIPRTRVTPHGRKHFETSLAMSERRL